MSIDKLIQDAKCVLQEETARYNSNIVALYALVPSWVLPLTQLPYVTNPTRETWRMLQKETWQIQGYWTATMKPTEYKDYLIPHFLFTCILGHNLPPIKVEEQCVYSANATGCAYGYVTDDVFQRPTYPWLYENLEATGPDDFCEGIQNQGLANSWSPEHKWQVTEYHSYQLARLNMGLELQPYKEYQAYARVKTPLDTMSGTT